MALVTSGPFQLLVKQDRAAELIIDLGSEMKCKSHQEIICRLSDSPKKHSKNHRRLAEPKLLAVPMTVAGDKVDSAKLLAAVAVPSFVVTVAEAAAASIDLPGSALPARPFRDCRQTASQRPATAY